MSTTKDEQYIKNGGNCCPRCRSDNIEGKGVEIEKGKAYQPCFCHDCEHEWSDNYTLTSVTHHTPTKESDDAKAN